MKTPLAKIFFDYTKVNTLVEVLAQRIKQSNLPIKSISGVPRGGLIPAVLLSHKLNIPYTSRVNPNTLLVDDIVDTGETLKNTSALYTASLIHKPHTSVFTPTFYAHTHLTDGWIVFFWERLSAPAIQDYKNKD